MLKPWWVLLGETPLVSRATSPSAGTSIVRSLRRRQAPHLTTVVAFFSGLLLVDGALSIVIIADAALGHSEAAKAASTWYCLALFFVLVAVPAAALFIAVRGLRAAHRTSPPDRAYHR